MDGQREANTANAVAAFHSQNNPVRLYYLQLTCEETEAAPQGDWPWVTQLERAGAEQDSPCV